MINGSIKKMSTLEILTNIQNQLASLSISTDLIADEIFTIIKFFLLMVLILGILTLLHKLHLAEKVSSLSVNKKQKKREFKQNIICLLSQSIPMLFLFFLYKHGLTKLYFDPALYGYGYFIFTIVLLMFFLDACYYWIHRWFHATKIEFFQKIHAVHHRSVNLNILSSFSMHPLEYYTFMFPPVICICIIPINITALVIFSIITQIFVFYGHNGYEAMPNGAIKNRIFSKFSNCVFHQMHHHYGKYNYGMYFTIWDRLMHTDHPDYEKTFNKIRTPH